MKKEKDLPISFRLSPMRKRLLEMAAKAEDLSTSKLIEEALSLRLAMPRGFIDEIQKIAVDMHLPMATIIVHKVLKQVAWEFAWLKVFGRPAPSQNSEFRFEGNKLITGDDLAEQLLQEFETILSQAKSKLQLKTGEAVHFSGKEIETVLEGLQCASH
ncbi:MAG: hypothetical protein AB1424_10990 [Thermodesulfobacteriota bacterium]